MNRTLTLALIASAVLAGCGKSNNNIVAGTPERGQAADAPVNTAGVVLPPMIEASKSYRCKDNAVVYIDWLNDKKTADIHASKEGSANRVVAAEAGKPMSGAGYSLTGTKDAASVSVERPGKGTQSCKA